MATKKPKTSAKSTKAKTTKPKTAAKTTVKPVSEAPKTKTVEKEEVKAKKKSCLSGFFAKKYEQPPGNGKGRSGKRRRFDRLQKP